MKKVLGFLGILLVSVCSGQVKPSNGAISDTTLFAALNLDYPGLDSVKYYVNIGNYKMAKQAYLTYRRTYPTKWTPLSGTLYPTITNNVDSNAYRISINRLGPNWQGYCPPNYDFGPNVANINWQYNYSTNPQWTLTLNRFLYWNYLYTGYWKTRNESYAKAWINQMSDWVSKNPVDLTTPWNTSVCQGSLEMGIRMTQSWNTAFLYFLPSVSFVDTAMGNYAKAILSHGWRMDTCTVKYVKSNAVPTNHQILMSAGLAITAMFWPEFRDAAKWQTDAFKLLMLSLNKTVYPDGAENELSPGYHNWSRDFFMSVVQIAQLNKVQLPVGFLETLKKMYLYDVYLQQPTGLLPPTNDNSDNISTSLNAATTFWGDSLFQYFTTNGTQGKAPDTLSYRFPWAGFNLMRSGWDKNANFMFFKNGPIGYFAHGHEDGLSLYLTCFGKPLLTEAGGWAYDGTQNMYYSRVTPAHNTITIDGKSQHRKDDPDVPNKIVTKPTSQPWLSNDVADYTSGIYDDGYQQVSYQQNYGGLMNGRKWSGVKDFSASHIRHLIFLKPYYYLVTDFVEGSGTHKYDNYFQLNSPAASIDNVTKAVKTLNPTSNTTPSAQLLVYPLETNGLSVKTIAGQTTPTYQGWEFITDATAKPIPSIIYSKTQAAPTIFSTFLYPYNTINTPIVNTTLINTAGAGIWACNGVTPYENFAIAIRRYHSLNGNITLTTPISFTANAEVSIVRQDIGSLNRKATFDSLTAYTDSLVSFNCLKANYIVYIDSANKFYLYNDNNTDKTLAITKPITQSYTILSHQWIHIDTSRINVIADPTITLVTPQNKIVMVQGDTTLITTNISDNGIPVSKVCFFDSPQDIGVDSLSPFQFVYSANAVGVHSIYAKLTNRLGKTAVSQISKISVSHFEAEDFTNNNTGTIITDSSRSSMTTVTNVAAKGWLEYSLNVNRTGKYSLDINLLNNVVNNSFTVSVDGIPISNDGLKLPALTMPSSSKYQLVNIPSFDVPSGIHTLRITFSASVNGVDYGQINYLTYYPVPGLIQAMNYNKTGTYSTKVLPTLISTVTIPEAGGGGLALNNIDSNWVEYAVKVAKAGTYTLQLNLSNRYGTGSKHVNIIDNGKFMKTVAIPSYTYNSNNIQAFSTVNTTINFPAAGNQIIRVEFYGTYSGITWLSFAPTGMSATITSPANNAKVNPLTTVTLSATATATANKISMVEFYNGDQLLGTDSTSPYNYSWQNIPAGTFRITAKAYDTSGNGFFATPITFQGNNTPPAINIVSPLQYTTFLEGSNFDITANASDTDGSIANVQFYNGINLLGSVADSPYVYQWYGSATGTYQITASATDNLGATTSTKPLTLSIGIFEAENWVSQLGTDTIGVAKASNGKVVYKIDSTNNYLDYLLNSDRNGQVMLGLNVSNSKLGRKLSILLDSVPVSLDGIPLNNLDLPITKNTNPVWTAPFDISVGQHNLRISFIGGVDSFDCMKINEVTYNEIPGTIKAEDWTINGTDSFAAPTLKVAPYTDFNGLTGTSVSNLYKNWIEYAVNVDTAGRYNLALTLANKFSNILSGPKVLPYLAPPVNSKRVDILLDNQFKKSLIPPDHTWDSAKTKIGFKTVSTDSFYFSTPGKHTLRLYFYGYDLNFDSMTLTLLSSSLPIKLASYNVQSLDGKDVLIDWKTTQEINNDYFIIQRSYDGKNFEAIAKIPSKGNVNGENYQYLDKTPFNGYNYYRLVQVDKDGHSTYYEVRLIIINNKTAPSFSVYPNPARGGKLTIRLSAPITDYANISLINALGRVIFKESALINGNDYSIQLPNDLPAGIYFLSLNNLTPKRVLIKQ